MSISVEALKKIYGSGDTKVKALMEYYRKFSAVIKLVHT